MSKRTFGDFHVSFYSPGAISVEPMGIARNLSLMTLVRSKGPKFEAEGGKGVPNAFWTH